MGASPLCHHAVHGSLGEMYVHYTFSELEMYLAFVCSNAGPHMGFDVRLVFMPSKCLDASTYELSFWRRGKKRSCWPSQNQLRA